MARVNALGSPGVYAISFKDTEYNPQTKIVEGTTGQKYASDYMGARSRWWDLSMKQAIYETGQIDAYNKAIDAEIVQIQKARNEIAKDYAKRYDAMQRHNDTIRTQREKFNASIFPRVTTVAGTRGTGRGGRGFGAPEGKARNVAILEATQGALVGSPSPSADAAALDVLTTEGSLYSDEYSRNMGAYYAVQQRIEARANEIAGQGVGMEAARTKATEDVLSQYDAGSPGARAMAARFRDVDAKITQDPTGTTYGYTKEVTSGKVPLPEREDLVPADTRAQLEELKAREEAARARRKPGLDIIERTRQIQREKFGPSITQAIREVTAPGRPRAMGRELRAIRRFLEAGGTMEELEQLTAPPTPTPPITPEVERDVTVRGVRPGVGEVPGRFTPPGRFLEADRFPPPVPPRPRTREEIEAAMPRVTPPEVRIGQPGMMETVSPRREAGMGLELGTRPGPGRLMSPQEIEAARRIILPRQEFFPGVPMGSEEQFRREEIEAAMPQITPPGVPSGVPGMIETVSPRREAGAAEPGLRPEPGKEKPKQRKTKLFGVDAGSPEQVQHRGNLLQGFTAAAGLLEKPKALDRKTANAPAGSPQQFARAIIDAERGKSPTERRPLKDLVANVAQQYNQMGDKKGRDAALENTIALYKLFLDETSLLG